MFTINNTFNKIYVVKLTVLILSIFTLNVLYIPLFLFDFSSSSQLEYIQGPYKGFLLIINILFVFDILKRINNNTLFFSNINIWLNYKYLINRDIVIDKYFNKVIIYIIWTIISLVFIIFPYNFLCLDHHLVIPIEEHEWYLNNGYENFLLDDDCLIYDLYFDNCTNSSTTDVTNSSLDASSDTSTSSTGGPEGEPSFLDILHRPVNNSRQMHIDNVKQLVRLLENSCSHKEKFDIRSFLNNNSQMKESTMYLLKKATNIEESRNFLTRFYTDTDKVMPKPIYGSLPYNNLKWRLTEPSLLLRYICFSSDFLLTDDGFNRSLIRYNNSLNR